MGDIPYTYDKYLEFSANIDELHINNSMLPFPATTKMS